MLTQTQETSNLISAFALQELSLIQEWPRIQELIKTAAQSRGDRVLESLQPLHYTDGKGIKYIIEFDNAERILIRLEVEIS